jgi:hypothetical protein
MVFKLLLIVFLQNYHFREQKLTNVIEDYEIEHDLFTVDEYQLLTVNVPSIIVFEVLKPEDQVVDAP